MATEISEDDGGLSGNDWLDTNNGPPSPAGSVRSESGEEPPSVGDGPSQPIQKRRRVTRACDECRRKKIKCDGKQPCTHCSVYSYGRDCDISNVRDDPRQLTQYLQNAHTTNPPTVGGILRRNISRLSKADYSAQKLFCESSCPMSTSLTRTWTHRFSKSFITVNRHEPVPTRCSNNQRRLFRRRANPSKMTNRFFP